MTVFYVQTGQYASSKIKFLIENTPLKLLFYAHEAVIFFFVLSGFVLALPFFERKVAYVPFIIKRIFRIYAPYYAAIILALLVLYKNAASVNTLISHALLIGAHYDYNAILGVSWSLVHEMRISIAFPLLILIVVRFKWVTSLGISLLLSSVASWLHFHFVHDPNFLINYYDSLHYAGMFIVGAVIAKHRHQIVDSLSMLSSTSKAIFILVGISLYTNFMQPADPNIMEFSSDWFTLAGASFFIVSSLSFKKMSRILVTKPLLWIGKTSDSLYLFHIVVLFYMKKMLYDHLPTSLLASLAIATSVALASLMFIVIERPFISLARYIVSTS